MGKSSVFLFTIDNVFYFLQSVFMPTGGISVPAGFQDGLSTQASALTTSLGSWLPVVLLGTLAIPVVVSFFRFITKTVRGGLRVR